MTAVLDDGVARKVEVLVTCESDDGGVEDCVLLAASAAIASLENTPLVLHAAPLTCAVTEDGAVLADPSIDEASGCARVTVVVGVDRSSGDASSLLKVSVNGAMPAAALERCVALSQKRAATIRWPADGRLNYYCGYILLSPHSSPNAGPKAWRRFSRTMPPTCGDSGSPFDSLSRHRASGA